MKIFEANRDQLTDPDKIEPGQVVKRGGRRSGDRRPSYDQELVERYGLPRRNAVTRG
jgi:nucleoid-associated protein YgaU